MILADKIINERKKNGWSQEELADMLGVSRQSVSKWEGAQSVPDLQKILKLAEKDDIEPEGNPSYYVSESVDARPVTRVTMEEAGEYIELRKALLPRIGIGVFLCITCPVLLIFLAGLSSTGLVKVSENAAAALGLIALFAHVVCSVLGLPEIIIIAMVCLLLIAVACGVYMFIAICGVTTSYKILLQMDDYTSRAKRTNDRLEPLSRVYWLLIVAIYLAVSFITMRWDRTWIIWAVSGVFFALVRAIATTLVGEK